MLLLLFTLLSLNSQDSKPLLDKLEEENKLIEILRRFSRQLDEGEDKKEEEDKNDMTLVSTTYLQPPTTRYRRGCKRSDLPPLVL